MTSRLRRLGFAACLIAFLAAACSPATQEGVESRPRPTPRGPNVVLIVLDTTRADILSAYGYPKPTSPTLTALASEGVLFRRAMSTDFWTLPAHASLFTGEYPSRHRATAETNYLRPSADTLAERLRRAGYRTRAYVSNAWIGTDRGFGQGFQSYLENWESHPEARGDYAIDRVGVDGATAWIAERARSDDPFFLFLNLNSAHMPYSPDSQALVDLSPGPRSLERTRRLRKLKGMWGYLGGLYSLDVKDFEIMRELYEAEILMLDRLVGVVVESLTEHGVLDDTLLIVTSDHGENLGEHGRIDHLLSMYDTTIHIPLIMRLPSMIEPGSVRDDLVSLVDVFPTVLDACGAAGATPEISERSLLRPPKRPSAPVYAENDRPLNGIDVMRKHFPEFDSTTIDHRMRMLRTETHKLIWYDDGRSEVYDLEVDPHELRDLSEENPKLRDELLSKLAAWMGEYESYPQPVRKEITDPATRERLRALGYVE